MKEKESSKLIERTLIGGAGLACAPVSGCLVISVLAAVLIFGAAGSLLGWLWGGGAPTGQASSAQAPAGPPQLFTPTPIPNNCFVTPTAVAVTVTPTAPAPATPQPPELNPGETPLPTPTLETIYLPTPTPCPTPKNTWDTPNPAWSPVPAGYGPHGSPFHSPYVFTQAYGCTSFPEFYDQACATATGGNAPWFHRGVDMVSLGNKTVFSTIEGTCIFAGWAGDGFGLRAYVRSGEWLVIYPHLNQLYVTANQPVSWGQPLGVEGSTGYSTGSHLHYEIHFNGAWIDSTPFLSR